MKKTSRAGVSDTRAGLQPAGLFSNAGIFKKGFQDFHPLDESPYLLFDAESSMLGNLENPTLDLDASKTETLDVITATRAGIATYTSSDGQIVTADENTVRVDWSLGYPAMLIEPSVENLVTDSLLFAELGDATRVGGIDAPDGSTNAKRISNAQAVNTTFAKCLTISIPTGVAANYVGSVYVRGTAGETVNVFMKRASGGTFVTSGSRSVLLTGDWQRVENLALTSDPTNSNLSVYFSSAGETADTIDVWGAQIEEGVVSTSIIPTSGSAVTRNADNLVIDGTAFSDFYNATEGTWYCEVVPKGNDGSANYTFIFEYGVDDLNRTGFFYYVSNGSTSITSFESGTPFYNHVRYVDHTNQLTRMAYSYKSGNHNSAIDGIAYSDTDAVVPAANQLRLGSRVSGSAGKLIGHIKRLIYWPTHSDSL